MKLGRRYGKVVDRTQHVEMYTILQFISFLFFRKNNLARENKAKHTQRKNINLKYTEKNLQQWLTKLIKMERRKMTTKKQNNE